MHGDLHLVGKVVEGTISRTADRWFLSLTKERSDSPTARQESPGCSARKTRGFGAGNALDRREGPGTESLCCRTANDPGRSQRFSRQREAAKVRAGLQPGQSIPKGMRIPWSKKRKKAQPRIARLHAQIRNIRVEGRDQLVTDWVERFDSIADRRFGEFRRPLEAKATLRGNTVVVNRWSPTRKTFSAGGYPVSKMPTRYGSGRVRWVRSTTTAVCAPRLIYGTWSRRAVQQVLWTLRRGGAMNQKGGTEFCPG